MNDTPGRFGLTTTLFPLILAGFLAGLSYWLYLAARPPAGINDGKSRHDPDYIVENLKLNRFDKEGLLQHTLQATHMKHYPDDDTTVVLAPNLTYHRTPPTHVTAREARLNSDAQHVELIGDVRVTRGGQKERPESVFTTDHLNTYPDDEIATTNQPVTLHQGATTVLGRGLTANNKTSIYLLEGPVTGVFHKNKSYSKSP